MSSNSLENKRLVEHSVAHIAYMPLVKWWLHLHVRIDFESTVIKSMDDPRYDEATVLRPK